jgi:heptosyltransferase I
VNRFLIVRLGSLGDVVHAIPVAAALRRAFPEARIDWLVGPKHREILDLVPVLDRRLTLSSKAFFRTVSEIRAARYDAAIDLQGLIKSAVVARLSGARRIIGHTARHLREPLARWLYTDVHDPGGGGGIYSTDETRHVVQLNLSLLEPLGVTPSPPEYPLALVESAAARAEEQRTAGRYALLNPGAAWPNKRWPPERLGAVAAALRDRHGLLSAVLWGPGERPLAEAVAAHSHGAAAVTAPTTVADVVALARGASILVSGDTGPMHIAAAVGTPLVGIYGPTMPERNGPWRTEDETVSRFAVCECHLLRRCTHARMCLLDIDVAEVVAAVERRLAVSSRP